MREAHRPAESKDPYPCGKSGEIQPAKAPSFMISEGRVAVAPRVRRL